MYIKDEIDRVSFRRKELSSLKQHAASTARRRRLSDLVKREDSDVELVDTEEGIPYEVRVMDRIEDKRLTAEQVYNRSNKKTKAYWDSRNKSCQVTAEIIYTNQQIIGVTRISPTTYIEIKLVARNGAKYLRLSKFMIKEEEPDKPIYLKGGFNIPLTCPKMYAEPDCANVLINYMLQAIDDSPLFNIEGEMVVRTGYLVPKLESYTGTMNKTDIREDLLNDE